MVGCNHCKVVGKIYGICANEGITEKCVELAMVSFWSSLICRRIGRILFLEDYGLWIMFDRYLAVRELFSILLLLRLVLIKPWYGFAFQALG